MLNVLILTVALSAPCDNGACDVPVVAVIASPVEVAARVVTAKPARKTVKAIASKPARRLVKARPVRRLLSRFRR